jgi:cell division protein FtsZ
MQEALRVTVIATGFGKAEEKAISRFKKIAPISISVRESTRESRDFPAFTRRVKVNERFDELKLAEPPDFSLEDEDRFDIPTFLRKQAD